MPGPEWNPLLVVLAVLAVLCGLALWQPWAGIIGSCLAFWALAIYCYLRAW